MEPIRILRITRAHRILLAMATSSAAARRSPVSGRQTRARSVRRDQPRRPIREDTADLTDSPILAANLAGTFVMLWADSRRVVNAPYSLHAAEGTASGVQRAQTIVPAAHTFAVDSEVAGIDRNGNAIAIWDDFGDDGYTYGVFETALHP